MKKALILIIVSAVLFSCKTCPPQKRAENKVAKIVACYPGIQVVDTLVLPEVVYKDSLIQSPVDTVLIDSLLLALAKTPDSIVVQGESIVRIREIINQEYRRSIEADTLLYSDSLVDIKFWIKDGIKFSDVTVKAQEIISKGDIHVTKTDNWFDKLKKGFGGFMIWIVIILAVLIGGLFIYKAVK